jgi:hypothetical protein
MMASALSRFHLERRGAQKPLETGKDIADLNGASKISYGVCNRIAVFQAEQGRQLLSVEFIHANIAVIVAPMGRSAFIGLAR